jgi:hypothetical protein
VRIQETHIAELLEIFHRYCPDNGSVFDLCGGTGSSMLAILRLGLKGTVNDRDERALSLGVIRARRYCEYLREELGSYPRLGARAHVTHNGTDLYAWVKKLLAPDAPVALISPSCYSHTRTLPCFSLKSFS